MFKKILVPLDGSKPAESILQNVQTIAGRCNALVILLKVQAPAILLGHDEVIDIPSYREMRCRLKREDERYLLSIGEKLRAEDIGTKTVVESGPIVDTILAVAAREDADLVAMATLRCSAWMQDSHPSVTTGVLARTQRPVIVRRSQRNAA